MKNKQLCEQFTATFQPNTIVSWEKLISAWKMNRSLPNIYSDINFNGAWLLATTIQDVCLELVKEEL